MFLQIDLSISAKDIAKLDTFSPSDPVAIVYEVKPDGHMQEVGRTERISERDHDPCSLASFCGIYLRI